MHSETPQCDVSTKKQAMFFRNSFLIDYKSIGITPLPQRIAYMKQFLSFVRKEFRQIFRDRRTLLILLIMPLMLVLLLGYAIKTELNDARVAVFDPSKDVETRRIIERLQASEYFTVVRELDSPAGINEVFRDGTAGLVVVFSEEFASGLSRGEAGIQLIADGTDPNQASLLTNYAQGVLAAYQAERMEQYRVPMRIETVSRMLYNPQGESAYNFVPGVMGIVLMLICALMTSVSIVRERETGTMEILLASPMKPLHIILSKMTPYFTLSVTNVVTILLLAVFVMGVPIRGSLGWLALVSVIFIIVALSLGLLISTLVDSQVAALLSSGIGLMMPTLVFSGLIFPLESMPLALRWIADIIPARWYISAMRKIMIQGVDVSCFATELGVLALMAAVLVAVSWKKFKVRLE